MYTYVRSYSSRDIDIYLDYTMGNDAYICDVVIQPDPTARVTDLPEKLIWDKATQPLLNMLFLVMNTLY